MLLRSDHPQLIGQRLEALVAESQRGQFQDFLNHSLATDARITCELKLTLHDQTELFVEAKAQRSPDGSECRFVLVDVTKRKVAEEQLARSERRIRAIYDTEPVSAFS